MRAALLALLLTGCTIPPGGSKAVRIPGTTIQAHVGATRCHTDVCTRDVYCARCLWSLGSIHHCSRFTHESD